MSDFEYRIIIETPTNKINICAKTQGEFNQLLKDCIPKLSSDIYRDALDQAYLRFKDKYPVNKPSKIWMSNLEKIVLGQYLKAATIAQTTIFINMTFNIKTSHSAIGRYWIMFRECGLMPLKSGEI